MLSIEELSAQWLLALMFFSVLETSYLRPFVGIERYFDGQRQGLATRMSGLFIRSMSRAAMNWPNRASLYAAMLTVPPLGAIPVALYQAEVGTRRISPDPQRGHSFCIG